MFCKTETKIKKVNITIKESCFIKRYMFYKAI